MSIIDPIYAVLLDTVSIQKYIFQTNKLKENLGGSFLLEEQIYGEYLKLAIHEAIQWDGDLDHWKKDPSKIQIQSEPIGYIGGGNALLFFVKKPDAQKFIKAWTKRLLVQAPGVQTAVALNKWDINDFENSFKNSRKRLFRQLQINKAKYIPQTELPRHGITSECTHSELSMDVWNSVEQAYVSSTTNSKIVAADLGKKFVQNRFNKELRDEFSFTDQLEDLGRIEGEDSHIAIVHIDGNNIGSRFAEMETLEAIRNLSIAVDKATKEAFSDLLFFITNNYDQIMESLGFDDSSYDKKLKYPRDGKNKKILPLRQIILGGDDVTFVCDGKLGLYFSKLFIEFLEKKKISDQKDLTACAGVAVIKTKYPFYRGYQLSQELCNSAKTLSKQVDIPVSCIDFHISSGGISGTLDEMREKYYRVSQGSLLFRPYKLVPRDQDEKSFDLLVQKTSDLKKFPNNKIHELREVLCLSKDATEQFVQEMTFRGRSFPDIPGRPGYSASLFDNGKTPYFDMVELMGLYPNLKI